MKLLNKFTLSVLAMFLISPVFFEIPVLWRWAEVNASQKFLAEQSSSKNTSQTSPSLNQAEILIWGRPGCGYTQTLIKSLEDWKFSYVYYDIDSPMSSYVSDKMSDTISKSGVVGRYTLPVVRVGEASIVGNPASMDDVVKAMSDQGKLPLQYIPLRIGGKMLGILILEIAILFYIWLLLVLFRITRGIFAPLFAKGK
ncbi:hypothetical protein [Microcoleus sp. PH2017_09_SFU_O_A]|nr:hypothetical protein [Microcoleus sp. PH2017_09_SFU_O_A]